MEIIVDNVHFNLTAEDIETADVQFTFWEGRRINVVCGTDLRAHPVKFNDLIRGVLAEDARIEDDEDKQQILKALIHLKDKGYPYTGPWDISVMLWFKQLIGNYSRQELLDQLVIKLSANSVVEEELFISEELEESDEQTLSTICNPYFSDVLPLVFKDAGRGCSLALISTCKVFYEVMTNNRTLNNYFREIKHLEESFKISKTLSSKPEMGNKQNEIFLLLREFNIKEKNIRLLKPYFLGYVPDDDGEAPYPRYIRCQLEYANSLANLDARSALKIVTLNETKDHEYNPTHSFFAAAAIVKNTNDSKLCNKTKVLKMGAEAWETTFRIRRDLQRFKHAIRVFEGYIGLDNNRARTMLSIIRQYFVSPDINNGYMVQTIAKTLRRLAPFEPQIDQEVISLLNKTLEIDFFANNGNDVHQQETLIEVAKTFLLFDQEKAIQALEITLNIDKEIWNLFNGESPLTSIAEVFAEFDQERAFELANQASGMIREEWDWQKSLKKNCQNCHFDKVNRIVKILAKSDEEYALKVLLTTFDDLHIANGISTDQYYSSGFDGIFGKLFMETIEVFALLDSKKALEITKQCIDWVKIKKNNNKKNDHYLVKLCKSLAINFPDEAIEVYELLEQPHFKCEALNWIVNQSIKSKIATSYVARVNEY
ncbi:MAG: hypothetical protein H0T62_13140 [Parachlamydiaceae bacterium]|nr:hypothetical protein [Parachlamydiaceae bacterium]